MKITSFYLPMILIILVLILLVKLGFWQLSRAEEKQEILEAINFANSQPAKSVSSISNLNNMEHRDIILTGSFLEQNFIYDNQTLDGEYGYFVITPFKLLNGEIALINRGFKSWNGKREIDLLTLETNNQIQDIKAKVKKPVLRMKLNNNNDNLNSPIILQNLDFALISKVLDYQLAEYIFLLTPEDKNGFIRKWQPFYGTVEKHIGYALQWFLMAIALLIIAIILLIKYKKLIKA